MAIMAKSMGEVTYKDISSLHKWALVILISMGSSIIYAPMYLKNVFYDPLMQALGCTNADLGMMVSAYGLAAMICYLPSGIIADKFRMRTLAAAGFLATAVLVFIYATLPSVGVCLALFVAMGVTSILVWWGTRFKVVRLCCEEEEYASKIGISYSIYGVTGLIVGLINAAIIAALSNTLGVAAGVQVMIIFLGVVIAILGVIVLPVTSGDTALRSCRLMVADYLHIDQKEKRNRIMVTLGIFIPVIAILVFAKLNAEGFNILWRYFAWANQTIAVFAFAAITVYLCAKKGAPKYAFLISLLPGTFYIFIISSFLLSQSIGFGLPLNVSYLIAGVIALVYLILVPRAGKKFSKSHTEE